MANRIVPSLLWANTTSLAQIELEGLQIPFLAFHGPGLETSSSEEVGILLGQARKGSAFSSSREWTVPCVLVRCWDSVVKPLSTS